MKNSNTVLGTTEREWESEENDLFKVSMIIRVCSVWSQKLNLNQEIKPQKRGFQLNRRSSEDRLVENELISFRVVSCPSARHVQVAQDTHC